MKTVFVLLLLVTVAITAVPAHAQGTAFAYQGRLQNDGSPANGNYDLIFTLYTTNAGGVAFVGPVTNSDTAVSNGLFTVTIDFGAGVFTGNNFWLDVSVSPAGSNAFTDLSPRQPILPTPYAMMADTASNLLGRLPGSQLTGPIDASELNGSVPTASLTSVPAGNLTGGVPLAQLPAAVLTNQETGVTLNGTFSGNGSGLTALNPANLNAGNAAINISGNAATATSAGTAGSATTAGSAATATLASNVVSGISITNAFITNSVFAGNGSALTGLNPTNLSAGTAAINISGNAATATSATTAASATVAGAAATTTLASNLVSGASINSAFVTNSTFAGNGSGLTNLNASQLHGSVPSTSLTSIPAGNLTGTVPLAQLPSAVLTNTETGVTLAGAFSGTFSGTFNVSTNVTAASISTNGSSSGQVLTSSGGVTTWANANPWLGGVPNLVTNGPLATNAVLAGRDRAFFLGFITSANNQQAYGNYFTIKLSQAVSTNPVVATFSPGTWGTWTNSPTSVQGFSVFLSYFQVVTTSNSITVQSVVAPPTSASYGMFVHVDQY